MNDAFATRVYPTILYVLDLLDRIRDRRRGEPTPQEELPRLKQYIGQLDSRGSDERDFELAKKALVYWIDEVLVNSDWSYAKQWKDSTLERELYDTRDRAWQFFDEAKVARTLSRPDSLETFYLCVALGFQGIYREGEMGPSARPGSADRGPAPPRPARGSRHESVSWFGGDSGMATDEATWGLPSAKPPTRPPGPADDMIDESVLDRPPVPGRGPAGATRDLPPTLEEWAGPVYAQIAPGRLRPFEASGAPESQRDARPLRGWQTLKRSLTTLAWMSVIVLALLAWKGFS